LSYRKLFLTSTSLALFSAPLFVNAQEGASKEAREILVQETVEVAPSDAAPNENVSTKTPDSKAKAKAKLESAEATEKAKNAEAEADLKKPIVSDAPAPMRPTFSVAPPASPPPPPPPPPRSRKKFTRSYNVIASKDGKSLHLAGDILSGMAKQLKRALKENPDAETLVLSSDGGLIIEGLAIGNLVAKNGLNTHIETVCASACTLAFLKGKTRSITKFGLLGFHQASRGSYYGSSKKPGDAAGNIVMVNAYRAGGANEFIIDNALNTPSTRMWYIDGKKAAKNISGVTVAADGSVDFSKGIWWSADDLRAKLLQDPVWKSVAKKRFYPAFSSIWTSGVLKKDMDDAWEVGREELKKRLLIDVMNLPDDLTLDLIALENDIWGDFEGRRNSNCFGAGIRRFPYSTAIDKAHKTREEQLLQKILSLPAPDDPTEKEMIEASAKVMEFWGAMVAATNLRSYDVKRKFCSEPKQYYEQLRSLPTAQQATIYRALATPEYRDRNRF